MGVQIFGTAESVDQWRDFGQGIPGVIDDMNAAQE